MIATVLPSPLSGTAVAPPSKSVAHRMLICAALADRPSTVSLAASNDDLDATISCLRALGAQVSPSGAGLSVTPIPRDAQGLPNPCAQATLNCKESGSTLRFLLPVVAALGCGASFVGEGRLAQRPLSPLYECLCEAGARLSPQGAFPLRVAGRLRKRVFTIAGNVSSQYVSGLLLAAPILGVATVHVRKPVESLPYIGLTLAAMRQFGVAVTEREASDEFTYRVPSGAAYHARDDLFVEGDWSAAAFWLCAAAMGNERLAVGGLSLASSQGDRAVLGALERLGCKVVVGDGGALAVGAAHLIGATLDARHIPDLVPPLAALAAVAKGTTRITGVGRLRLKESDRVASVTAALSGLGARVEAEDDRLVVTGKPQLAGGRVDAANDHRIAMMAAIAASRCAHPVEIVGAECVSKSYPAFFEDLRALSHGQEAPPAPGR